MKVNIIAKEQNPLLKRKEIIFNVDHAQIGGTPSRIEVSKQLASLMKTKLELVYVKKMKTKRGQMIAVGEANVYDSIEQGKLLEPKHVIAKNALQEKPKEPQDSEKIAEEQEKE